MGTLDDIPYELANTIANIYYRFHVIEVSLANSQSIPSIIDDRNIFDGLKSFSYEFEKVLAVKEIIPDTVKTLRQIDRAKQPNLYKALVNFILDQWKYDIRNAHKKIGIRRRIERIFKKKHVREIPNLIDLIRA